MGVPIAKRGDGIEWCGGSGGNSDDGDAEKTAQGRPTSLLTDLPHRIREGCLDGVPW